LSSEGDEEASRFVEALQKRDFHDWEKELLLVADQVERGFGTRYLRVPSVDSHDAYGDMEDFVETVENKRLQERLWDAIRGRGAFRRFKGCPHESSSRERALVPIQHAQMRQRVLDWLKAEGIQPTGE